jgi:4-diphosphocytidyl-2-C-methyl-D-erythritol kinase
MLFKKIKSFAKINLALNVLEKTSNLHTIESLIAFTDLNDLIFIKKIKSNKHQIKFYGKFSKGINKKNTISDLLNILDNKKILKDQKFSIRIKKNIPQKAGLGGGSMNAATILKYFMDKRIIKITKKQLIEITKLIGSDVILGINKSNTILTSKNLLKRYKNYEKIFILLVKPNFGCTTKDIYSGVKKFTKSQFNKPQKKMFDINYLKNLNNDLENIAFKKYPKLKLIKLFIIEKCNPIFVRMTGSGSTMVAYFTTKKACEKARIIFTNKFKNYWCISSKTI